MNIICIYFISVCSTLGINQDNYACKYDDQYHFKCHSHLVLAYIPKSMFYARYPKQFLSLRNGHLLNL